MKYLDEFRSQSSVQSLTAAVIEKALGRAITIMEVCGTHTMSIARNGIKQILPENIRLISGPGCPVCVTPNRQIDTAIALARESDIIIATFGDMIRVPGSSSSLEKERSMGSDVRVVASTLDALKIAEKNPQKEIVFIGVGFETTSPTIAASILAADADHIQNYSVLCAHKVIPPAMEILSKGEVNVHGYLCPGHVSAIIGADPYKQLADTFGIACVIAGFEPLDILQSIYMLVDQIVSNRPQVEIQYSRVVKPEGNPAARQMIQQVFAPCDSEWRGIGEIPGTGLAIKECYSRYDAEKRHPVSVEESVEPKGCVCGSVLQGLVQPEDCPLFGKGCTPMTPIGPCMVSSEGSCAASYKYRA